MNEISLTTAIATVVTIAGGMTGFNVILKPFNEMRSDVKRLKYTVFGDDQKENILATKQDMNSLSESIEKLATATNLMYRAFMTVLDELPESEKIKTAIKEIEKHQSIV